MANFFIPILAFFTLVVPLLLSSPATAAGDDFADSFVRPIDRKLAGLKKEKFSHFRLYWHDILVGGNRSAVTVLPPVNTSTAGFGLVNMIDNALTVGPDLRSSKLVGRAEGFYAATSLEEVSVLMAMNFVFTEGKYNGSSVTLVGRNSPPNKVRELPVIGGSGLFRFASGYAKLTTYSLDFTTGNAVVEYNVYVKHYG